MFRFTVVLLSLLLLTACVSFPPTATPPAVAQQPTFPAVVTFTPSPTPTPTATPDRVATALARPTRTPRPTFTPTSTPTPTPTYPVVVWHPAVADQLITLPANEMAWSPLSNQLVYSDCPHHLPEKDHTQPAPAGGLFLAQAPHFEPQEITPAGFTRPSYFQFFLSPTWQPNEQSILYSQPFPPDNPSYESPGLYQLLLADQTVVDLKISGWWQRVNGWLTPTQIIISHYFGAGNWHLTLFDLELNQTVAKIDLRGGSVRAINPPWVATNYSIPVSFFVAGFAGAFSNHPFNVTATNNDGFHNRFIRYLRFEHPENPNILHSIFVDWLSGTPQMLVLTTANQEGFPYEWGSGLPTDILTDLQLWNVETDELTPLIPNGVWGNFSPDQTYLTFIQHQENQYSWQLLNRVTGENHLIHTMPLTEIELLSFSPSGRYIIFAHSLPQNTSKMVLIYDVMEQKIVVSMDGIKNIPLWSPAGDNLVYQQDEDWSVLYVPTNTTQRLTMKNSLLVRNPQWSFDGSYLSFDVGDEMVIWPIPAAPPN